MFVTVLLIKKVDRGFGTRCGRSHGWWVNGMPAALMVGAPRLATSERSGRAASPNGETLVAAHRHSPGPRAAPAPAAP
jgi:hypothetical protein